MWITSKPYFFANFASRVPSGEALRFISYGAHENTAGSMVHAVLVDYKSKISRGHT